MSILKNIDGILEELDKAKDKFPKHPNDVVHMAGIICEEAGEIMKAALDYNYSNGSVKDIEVELKQTAAMCLRGLDILKHLKKYNNQIFTQTFTEYFYENFNKINPYMKLVTKDQRFLLNVVNGIELENPISVSVNVPRESGLTTFLILYYNSKIWNFFSKTIDKMKKCIIILLDKWYGPIQKNRKEE